MTDNSFANFDVCRDYERGKVGIQLEGMPRRLLDPDEAREQAAELETNAPDYFTFPEGVEKVDDIAETLREYAADVEAAANS